MTSARRDDDFRAARPLAVLAGDEHDDDADRLAAARRLRRLGQRAAILRGDLLAYGLAIAGGEHDRLIGRRRD
ncbi:MAG: hypothetical protein J0H31_08915, partial [Alphaproteobacteria bacterium]|nr:hypothetical protein [Alphaproteobacteria bacterium]